MLEKKRADITEIYKNMFFGSWIKNAPSPFEAMKNMNGTATKGFKIYGAWLKYVNSVTDKGFETGCDAIAGEEIKVDTFFKTFREAYDNFTDQVTDAFKDTPFEGIKEIDKAVKKSLDVFSHEQKEATGFLKNMCEFNNNMIDFSLSAMGNISVAKTLQEYDTIPNFIGTCTEFLESTNKLCRGISASRESKTESDDLKSPIEKKTPEEEPEVEKKAA
ncbi:hypothetical protein [Desulfonema magnum]|uniref:Uncharacterized protein n=1 Tax=Desulfonema magnum TaxID=45655 RepID=A0A975BND6_9BACT|nr:hypothetical protein [Desulfonema magnum]QTA88732.1 Uncharacterized protein dnm_047790 [Desulfonema magnum]